jgi:hypothetical protein
MYMCIIYYMRAATLEQAYVLFWFVLWAWSLGVVWGGFGVGGVDG